MVCGPLTRLAHRLGFAHVPAMPQATSENATRNAPDFRNVDSWIFDLDHTLYRVDPAVRAAVEERICLFIQRHFDIGRDPAWEIQKRYYHHYGITLAGLMKHHGVDPEVYHDFINDLDLLDLGPDDELARGLSRLPGRRFVFTNNCGRFANGVLERLGIAHLFESVWDIHAGKYIPKPMISAYDALVVGAGLAPKRSAMFEDTPRNLEPAHSLGMATVLLKPVSAPAEAEAHIHHETDDLPKFLQEIRI
jgi:putative hydrolase of the HAD superfamily